MSLLLEAQHALIARRKKQRRKHRKQKVQGRSVGIGHNLGPPLDAPLTTAHPNQVLTFHEWCQLNRISARTGRRILTSGTGPVVTQLSAKRIGVTVGNNAAWQASKARG